MNSELQLDNHVESTTEINYPDSLFDEDVEVEDTPIEDEVTESEEEQVEEVPTTTEEGEVTEKPQMLTLKYNGEVKEITLDEAVALAQKGMNYDKKLAELEALKNSRQIQMIERLAKESNLSVEEYLDSVEQQFEKQTIAKIGDQIRRKYPDIDKAALEEMAKSQYALIQQDKKQKELEESKNSKMQEEDIQKKEEERLNQMVSDFLEEYPEVNLEEELKDAEFAKLLEKGESLVSAYRKIENQRLKTQLNAEKLNNKNKAKSTGSLSSQATALEQDAFRNGFWD